MSSYTDFFTWLADGRWIRVSARAIPFNRAGDHVLVERNHGSGNDYLNFIGGGVEVDESLQECVVRELTEETDAQIVAAQYLFVVENFMPYGEQTRHSLEHYFAVTLDRELVRPRHQDVEFVWLPIAELAATDLRPIVVRDSLIDGSYARVAHLLLRPSH
jgi:8-oxo-dGTP pyrophosphatase MutT (NUDIX family)